MRSWMYCTDPTSRPRVGWDAISSLIGRENSRATMTFCWFPPESVPAEVQMDGVRTSNSFTRSAAVVAIASRSIDRPCANGA